MSKSTKTEKLEKKVSKLSIGSNMYEKQVMWSLKMLETRYPENTETLNQTFLKYSFPQNINELIKSENIIKKALLEFIKILKNYSCFIAEADYGPIFETVKKDFNKNIIEKINISISKLETLSEYLSSDSWETNDPDYISLTQQFIIGKGGCTDHFLTALKASKKILE